MPDRSFQSRLIWASLCLVLVSVITLGPALIAVELVPGRGVIGAAGSDDLQARFGQHGYDLDRGEPVPRLFASRLPGDWPDLEPPARRKRLFVMAMLPLILRENEGVLAERSRISRLVKLSDRSRREERWLRIELSTMVSVTVNGAAC